MRFPQISTIAAGVAVLAASHLVAQTPGDDLLGLWGAEAVFGPQVRGQLVVEQHRLDWTARVSGFEATATQHDDSVNIALVGGQGRLKLWIKDGTPQGLWIQPTGIAPEYATPLRFRPTGSRSWRAEIHPLEERFPLYLTISRASDGGLRGVFRNPEVNWPGRAGWYGVERDGSTITFVAPRTGKVQWRQAYDSAQRTITFDFGGSVVLHPRTREEAVGLMARSPSLAPYEYRQPVDLADGWRLASASAVGLDTTALQALVRELVAADPLSDTLPRVHSLLIARRGRLVLDEYFRGYSADQLHDLRSASKTMTSVMFGAAMRRDKTLSVATHVSATPITVAQLLTHTSGVACDDDDEASPGNEDTMQSQHAQDDWYKFFVALPTRYAPGTHYAYCSAGINMVGSIIGQASHMWLPMFFDRYVAQPMHISHYAVNLMPSGEAYSGGGMHMRPRDFLKFGQLYLGGGQLNGVRIVSERWARQSTSHQVDRPDGSTDGFGWHRHVIAIGQRSYQTYEASGNGGQFVVVVPDLQLVVAVTAGNYGQYSIWTSIRNTLVLEVMRAAH